MTDDSDRSVDRYITSLDDRASYEFVESKSKGGPIRQILWMADG
jgi:hypothetical protein